MSFPTNLSLPYISNKSSVEGPQKYDLKKELPNKKVVITSAVGAFTPPCSEQHIPTYLDNISKFKAKNVDQVIVLTVNDPFVNHAWAKSLGYTDDDDFIIFAQDPDLELSKQLGENYTVDMSKLGLGVRSNRYAAFVDDGKIEYLGAEEEGAVTNISIAGNILSRL